MGEFIGDSLREAREGKQLSFSDIEQEIKIREKYLRALEKENYEIFPAEIYVTGFLNSYSKYLGLDADNLVKNYWRIHQEKDYLNNSRDNLSKTNKKEKNNIILKKISIIVGVSLGITVLSFLLFRVKSESNKKVVVRENTYKEEIAVVPVQIKIPEKVYLEIKGEEATWLRVIGDGDLAYEGLIKKDEVMFLEAKEKFKIRIGNIFGIKVKFNGESIDIISGQRGEVNEIFLEKDRE
ncbi:helix-turn-helix domain-containing protein [bacterium]|nr:helix-turn-helix domain-containing protein [bacterium]